MGEYSPVGVSHCEKLREFSYYASDHTCSCSLLNPDITPAAYWVVNPNNILRHNAAAGGTHFGFWFRIQAHPDGPSVTDEYCTNKVPLGVFQNNTAHSFGWYGIWIFSMDGWFPSDGTREKGYCDGQNAGMQNNLGLLKSCWQRVKEKYSVTINRKLF